VAGAGLRAKNRTKVQTDKTI